MAEVNTDSYPKATMLVSPLDVAGKLGGLQQQALGISQAKLDQANQGFDYLTRAMASIGPNPGPDWKQKYMDVGANAVKMGLVPSEQLQVWADRVNQAPDSNTFFNQTISAVQSHQQILQNYKGAPAQVQDQSNNYQGMQGGPMSPSPGGFTPATKMPVQLPPTTPTVSPQGQAGYVGPSGPSGVQPVPIPVQRPQAIPPGPVTNPAIQGPSANFGGNVVSANVEPPNFKDRFGAAFTPSANPPNYEIGQKMLAEDQSNAAQKMTAIKPAILGLKLLPGLATGPGTEAWNKGVGFLKAQGIIPLDTDPEKDKTVIYEKANKYFSQYLKGRGGRSDADLAAAEKSSPNVGSQLNPALVELTKSAVAQDMMEAARPTAFTKSGRTDLQNYGEHRATFPQSMDQRAFEAATLPEDERNKVTSKFINRYQKNPKDKEAIKFLNSLDVADKSGMMNPE